jgi:hypothetical protein
MFNLFAQSHTPRAASHLWPCKVGGYNLTKLKAPAPGSGNRGPVGLAGQPNSDK